MDVTELVKQADQMGKLLIYLTQAEELKWANTYMNNRYKFKCNVGVDEVHISPAYKYGKNTFCDLKVIENDHTYEYTLKDDTANQLVEVASKSAAATREEEHEKLQRLIFKLEQMKEDRDAIETEEGSDFSEAQRIET